MALHQPKGGMCAGCEFVRRDCSSLPFHSMPVIRRDHDRIIVKCVEHKRAGEGVIQ